MGENAALRKSLCDRKETSRLKALEPDRAKCYEAGMFQSLFANSPATTVSSNESTSSQFAIPTRSIIAHFSGNAVFMMF